MDIYFVQNDEKDSFSPTITVGLMIDNKQGIFNLKRNMDALLIFLHHQLVPILLFFGQETC